MGRRAKLGSWSWLGTCLKVTAVAVKNKGRKASPPGCWLSSWRSQRGSCRKRWRQCSFGAALPNRLQQGQRELPSCCPQCLSSRGISAHFCPSRRVSFCHHLAGCATCKGETPHSYHSGRGMPLYNNVSLMSEVGNRSLRQQTH